MYDLVLTVCLLATPEVCVDRRLPAADATSLAACRATADARAEAWVRDRAGLRLEARACAEAASAPALEAVEIAPGVLVHAGRVALPGPGNGGDTANLGAVIGEDAVAVIDAGGSRAVGEAWLAAIRRATETPVRWLILTHMHPDHALGAEVFREAGARILGHANLAPALEARHGTYEQAAARQLGPESFAGTRIVQPDESLAAPRELDLGGRTLLVEPHPTAHTDNDLTVLDRRTGTLFSSDLVFLDHAPALDGSIVGWLAVLAALTGRDDVERVVPGHGPPSASWPAGAAATVGYLDALAEQTRAAIAAGEPMSHAVEHLGRDQRARWSLFGAYNTRNATAAFKELEWE